MIFRQPLVHFLLIGIGIFAVFEVREGQTLAPVGLEIVVTLDKAVQLAARFEADQSRPPSVEELEALIDGFIREEMLVREAKSLSLDQDDAFIRRRLSHKMEALVLSAATAMNPSEDELRAHFANNSDRFAVVEQIAFEQVFIGAEPSDDKVERVLDELRNGAKPADFGARRGFPSSLPLSPRRSVDDAFSTGFFDRLFAIESDDWSGPIQSRYGSHIVRITGRRERQAPEFEAVRAAVLRDVRAARAPEITETQLAQMLERYQVSRPDLSQLEPVAK